MTMENFHELPADGLSLVLRIVFGTTLVLFAAGIATVLFRHSSAALRHRIWSLGLLSCLLIPPVIATAPNWQVEWWKIDEFAAAETDDSAPQSPALLQEQVASSTSPPLSETEGATLDELERATENPVKLAKSASEVSGASPVPQFPDNHPNVNNDKTSAPATQTPSRSGLFWLSLIWMTGTALGLLRIFRSVRLSRLAAAGSVSISDPSCHDLLERLTMQLGLSRPPRLLESDRITSPVCLGFRRSTILLPSSWREWEQAELRSVLLHELGHVRRGDVAWQFLAGIACSVYWFHPLVWLAAWRMRVEREYACDDLVVHSGEPPAGYARLLLHLAEQFGRRNLNYGVCAIGMARSSTVESRIVAVLQTARNRKPLSNRASQMSSIVAALLVGVAGVMNPLFSEVGRKAENDVSRQQNEQANAVADSSPVAASELMKLPARAIFELGSPLLHQRSSINEVLFSPRGDLVASCGVNANSHVRLWSVSTGQLVQKLSPEVPEWNWVGSMAFTPDQQHVFAGYLKGQLRSWDLKSGTQTVHTQRHKGKIRSIAVSPDGKLLATGGDDGAIRISRIGNLDEQVGFFESKEQLPGEGESDGQYGVGALKFTPDGEYLVAGLSKSYQILILNAADGTLVRMIDFRKNVVKHQTFASAGLQSLSISPDGRRIYAGYYVYIPRSEVPERIVSDNSSLQITGVSVWDLDTGEKLKELRQDRYDIGFGYSALSPDGESLVLGLKNQLIFIDADSGETLRSIPVPGWWGDTVQFSPNGQFVTAGEHISIGLWDANTGERLFQDRPSHRSTVDAIDYSPDGKLIVTVGDNRFHVWEAESGKHLFTRTLGADAHLWDVQFSADSQSFAISGSAQEQRGRDFGISVVWGIDGKEKGTFRFQYRGEGVTLSPDGTRLVVAYNNGGLGSTRLELWSLGRRRRRLAEFPRNPQEGLWQYEDMQFSPDGRYILIAESNGKVTKWDTSEEAADSSFVADWRPEEHRNDKRGKFRRPDMFDADFTPDGKYLVSSAYDIHIWDVETGQLHRTIEIPTVKKWVNLKVAPDNRTIATSEIIYAGEPGTDTIRLFDLTTGEQTLTLEPNDDRAFSFAFSPDSKRLVTGLTRGTALVWDISERTGDHN